MSAYSVAKPTKQALNYGCFNVCTGQCDRRTVSLCSNLQREETQKSQCSGEGFSMNLLPQVFLFKTGRLCVVHL